MDDDLISISDYNLPYDICKYLDNAVEIFEYNTFYTFELRHDDKFIKNHTTGIIKPEWNWDILYDVNKETFTFTFPNDIQKTYSINDNVLISNIEIFYSASKKDQIIIYLTVDIDLDDKPKLPIKWSVTSNVICDAFILYTYTGPKSDGKIMNSFLQSHYKQKSINCIIK